MTLRLPDSLIGEIETEAQRRGLSKSDVVRERLERGKPGNEGADPLADIRDLIGSIDDPNLPRDLSSRKKHYLRSWGYGRKRSG
ncbi:MAG TPA: CopG family transcriptional regulator [Rhizomicrobium sp.]|jgi:hypothetical protein